MNDPRENLPSASSMWRTVNCSGWLALSRDLPRKDTPDSLAGTAGHAALAGEDIELDSKMEMTVEMCREIEARIVAQLGFEKVTPSREERLWFNRDGVRFSGQMDVGYKYPRRGDEDPHSGLVIDFKTLHGRQQPAAENLQLRTLVVLMAENWGCEFVTAAIVAPWIKNQFSLVEYGPEEIATARTEVVAAVKATLAPDAPRTPGDWCKWCPAKAICPEANSQSEAVTIRAQWSLESLSTGQRGHLLDQIIWAEDILAAKKAELRSMLESDPAAVEGWMLKPGKNRRTISNVNAAYDAFKGQMTLQEFIALCQLSPAKIEEFLYQQDKKNHTRKEVEARVAIALGDLVETKPDKPSLSKSS